MPTESTFFLAGLFIVAAAAGWAFARYSRGSEQSTSAPISADYIRGLNLVLNRKTDEALELFVRLAEVDDETLETHFALGHLFRRRGEIDRAIRIHQNLLARPNLSQAQRDQALFALGQDYLGAGLFDRAEKLFSELADSPTQGETALENLLSIYERESDWERAVETRQRLHGSDGENADRIAHYYCELAERARRRGDLELARSYLKQIARGRQRSRRGALVRASVALEEEDHATASRLFHTVLEQDGYLIGEVLPQLLECHGRAGTLPQLEEFLVELVQRHPELETDLAVTAILSNLLDEPALYRNVESFVLHNDTLASLVDVDAIAAQDDVTRNSTIRRIAGGLRRLAMGSARYRCSNCGYGTRQLIWHCPGCKSWETVRPANQIQFEGLLLSDSGDEQAKLA